MAAKDTNAEEGATKVCLKRYLCQTKMALWHERVACFSLYQRLQYSASALIEGHLSLTESVDASNTATKRSFQLENICSKETPTSSAPYYQQYKTTSNFQ